MKVSYIKKTRQTARRLREKTEDDNRNILFNLGNGDLNELMFGDYGIINKSEAVRNSVNKKKMFELFKEHDVNSLTYFDLKKRLDVLRAKSYIFRGNKLVLRKGKRLKVVKLDGFKEKYRHYDYATLKENKQEEYRVLVFKGRVFRVMLKKPKEELRKFKLKQKDCNFEGIKYTEMRQDVLDESVKAVNSVGLDLSGVDVLINERDEVKVIEVNSGMGLSYNSIRKLLRRANGIY